MPQISDTLKNQFIDFLKTEDYMFVTKDGKLEHTYYCDYNDKISSKTIEKIIKDYKDTAATIQDTVLLYAYDNNWYDYYTDQHHQSVVSFITKTGLEYSDYLYDQLLETFYEAVTIDEDIPQLLAQSYPEDLTFTFDKKDATRDMYDIFDNDKDNLDDSTFGWFLNTQGYTVSDLYTKKHPLVSLTSLKVKGHLLTSLLKKISLSIAPSLTVLLLLNILITAIRQATVGYHDQQQATI